MQSHSQVGDGGASSQLGVWCAQHVCLFTHLCVIDGDCIASSELLVFSEAIRNLKCAVDQFLALGKLTMAARYLKVRATHY